MTEDIDSYEDADERNHMTAKLADEFPNIPGVVLLRDDVGDTAFEWPKLSNQSEIPTFQ